MEDSGPILLAFWHISLRELLFVIALGVTLSGLDDLFIDAVYFTRTLWRRLTIYTRHDRASAESLRRFDPGPIAIFIPAWDEAAVIGAMLRFSLTHLDYDRYRIFVGLYPNDPEGRAAVAAVGDHRVQAVLCRRPGPTTKADCLNRLWHAMLAREALVGERYKAVVLHDAEDVIHPQELWIYDALIPRLAMVQLPVLPLPDTGSRWISGHYADEFAENHTKDMVVREALGAAVPSAGVACAIDRAALGMIADRAGADAASHDSTGYDRPGPFNAASLTEDYELGYRIKALGGRGALVRLRSGDEPVVVATREHFPDNFDAALRQKSRWLVGIALSGWDRIGWPGGLADRYLLLRDRKSLLAALLTLLAYLAAVMVLIDIWLRQAYPMAAALPPLAGRLVTAMLWFNAALLAWRLLMRAAFTAHAYGPIEGIRAIPRALTSNVINAAAAWSAARRYHAIVRGNRAQTWDKTEHRFPPYDPRTPPTSQ
ncbi:hypothetical protein GCM10011529_23740 [Polymorphobacter glacialis]|uniref:Glycosyl transferase family protein n=1 Tax=Sandarakinorhabdus glacialis TaxID=1614636 RepID=A0A916ZW09_9SPHN|nr:glycosyl transferase family protein [Polymorphobacter glacialis]GGE16555.1 hypothetical protein GCM10011529_23740 [Polymorphobacter glacialis]